MKRTLSQLAVMTVGVWGMAGCFSSGPATLTPAEPVPAEVGPAAGETAPTQAGPASRRVTVAISGMV